MPTEVGITFQTVLVFGPHCIVIIPEMLLSVCSRAQNHALKLIRRLLSVTSAIDWRPVGTEDVSVPVRTDRQLDGP